MMRTVRTMREASAGREDFTDSAASALEVEFSVDGTVGTKVGSVLAAAPFSLASESDAAIVGAGGARRLGLGVP
jgi:hypothetical protein